LDKTERLLDLVALLLGAAEPVSFAELRELFPEEYGGQKASAERKLERLSERLEALSLAETVRFAHSFACFLQIANIAEDQNHIRQTRAQKFSGGPPPRTRPS